MTMELMALDSKVGQLVQLLRRGNQIFTRKQSVRKLHETEEYK